MSLNIIKKLADTLDDLSSTEVATLVQSDEKLLIGGYSRIDFEGDHIAYVDLENLEAKKLHQASVSQSLRAKQLTLKLITEIIKS